MTIRSAIHLIDVEVKSIKESEERIKLYAAELNEFNPFIAGQELVVNGCYSHQGKTLVVEKFFVSDFRGMDVEVTAGEPLNFTATCKVKKKDGNLSVYNGVHSEKITDWI